MCITGSMPEEFQRNIANYSTRKWIEIMKIAILTWLHNGNYGTCLLYTSPIYVVFKKCGLSNRWFTLLLPYVSFGLPMGIFLVEGYVKTIPVSLEEAAAIDGSSFSYTLWHIIFPICKPILVTVAIIQVFSCWNEFSFALVLIKDVGLQTVPLALTQFKGQFASDYPKQMAAMLITMSPIVILYFV